jgi:ADP-heptose:LPS heptosyltransferase
MMDGEANVLALQLKRIGDLVLTAPVLAALAGMNRGLRLALVTTEGCAELAGCIRGVDRVIPWRKGAGAWPGLAEIGGGEWRACLDFTGTDRSALLTALSRADERVGYAKFAGGARGLVYTRLCGASVRDLHTVDFHRSLVECWTGDLAPLPEECPLVFEDETAGRVDALRAENGLDGERGFVIAHPGTAREEKFWQVAKWRALLKRFAEAGWRVALTGTGAGLEKSTVDELRSLPGVVDLTGRLSLPELACLMGKASLAVGVDSMAMHLAAMRRIPQVVLFGPTNPFHWRPLHPRAAVVTPGSTAACVDFDPRARGGRMEDVSLETVWREAGRLLAVDFE